VLALGEV